MYALDKNITDYAALYLPERYAAEIKYNGKGCTKSEDRFLL